LDVIELSEAFAAQGLAVLRDLRLADDDSLVNPTAVRWRSVTLWA
jgi:acetyl-CoA acetyltransferase